MLAYRTYSQRQEIAAAFKSEYGKVKLYTAMRSLIFISKGVKNDSYYPSCNCVVDIVMSTSICFLVSVCPSVIFPNIYNGIIFPSLNLVKIFDSIPDEHSHKVLWMALFSWVPIFVD